MFIQIKLWFGAHFCNSEEFFPHFVLPGENDFIQVWVGAYVENG